MTLSSKQLQFLKAGAHSLNPVVLLGNDGLTEAVIKEINHAISHHELIKIRLNGSTDRKSQAEDAAKAVGAHLVQTIGKIAVLFKQKEENSRFILPKK